MPSKKNTIVKEHRFSFTSNILRIIVGCMVVGVLLFGKDKSEEENVFDANTLRQIKTTWLTTTNDSFNTIANVVVPVDSAIIMDATIKAISGKESFSGKKYILVKNIAGRAFVIGEMGAILNVSDVSLKGLYWTIDVLADHAIIQVRGMPGRTINWQCTYVAY